MIIPLICTPRLFSRALSRSWSHLITWTIQGILLIGSLKILGFPETTCSNTTPPEGTAPWTSISSHLGGSWQLAENQAQRSWEPDWEELEDGQEEKEAKPLPAVHLTVLQTEVPCEPFPASLTHQRHRLYPQSQSEKTRRKREATGEMRRWNKPTIRGSSILIHFILQNATQLKVKKLTEKKKKKRTGEKKSFHVLSSIAANFF